MSALQANPFLMAGGDSEFAIQRSLRFNDDDQSNLSRTPSAAGNRKKFTWSGWTKRSELGGTQRLMFVGPGSNYFSISFNNDKIQVEEAGGSNSFYVYTNAVFRDPSAWYHVVIAVDTTQSTQTNRVKVYVNGTDQPLTAGNNWPPQNADLQINNTVDHRIGRNDADCFNGFLADVHFIDGQALAPTDFGETDDNGVWQPIKYAGSYGTNGFHLDFADNSSASALGNDAAGSNNWTVNNLSVTAGAGNDSLRDSPSQIADQSDTGAGGEVVGNYATWNPLVKFTGVAGINQATEYSNGNLQAKITTGGSWTPGCGTIAVNSGKWYAEFEVADKGGANHFHVGINPPLDNFSGVTYHSASNSGHFYGSNGELWNAGSASGAGSYTTADNNDIIGIALDFTASTVTFYKNGSSIAAVSLNSNITTHGAVFAFDLYPTCTVIANFGQRAFAYTAPSGYKCLCTANLPEPTIADGSQYFDTKLWTGNGTNQNISTSFSPDWVWVKERGGTGWNNVYDVIRGVKKSLITNDTRAEQTLNDGVTAFNSNSFTVSHDGASTIHTNSNGDSYVGWTWDAGSSTVSNTDGSITSQVRANPTAGFSIVTYTSPNNSSNQSFGHGLNAKPNFVLVKNRDSSYNWDIYHSSLGYNSSLIFTNASTRSGAFSSEPTSTVVNTSNSYTHVGSNKYVAFCFAEIEGYSAFGSYTGNGSSDGPFVALSFAPRWVMVKGTNISSQWRIWDSAREPNNPKDNTLHPSDSQTETHYGADDVDFLSNGFKNRNTGSYQNSNGKTYIYAAFAENPFKTARAR